MKSEYDNPEYAAERTELKTELERLKKKFNVERKGYRAISRLHAATATQAEQAIPIAKLL